MKFILAATIGISLFVLFQILRKEAANKLSMRIALALQVVWLIRFVLIYVKIDTPEPPGAFLIIYDQTLFLLDGPLIWLYTRSLLKSGSWSFRTWLHFLPFLLLALYSTYLAASYPALVRNSYQEVLLAIENGEPFVSEAEILYVVVVLSVSLGYLIRSVKLARSYNLRLLDNFSSIDDLSAHWVISFQRMWIVLFVFPVFLYFINYIWPLASIELLAWTLLIPIIVLSLIFNSNLIHQGFTPVETLEKKKPAPIPESNEDSLEQLYQLKELLDKNKYYLDDELSLNQLAAHMNLKPVKVTELIKISEYDNFYDLINSYRINEIKKELLRTDDQIIQLAYQNGFKSKSTFNKIFKEKTGMTPKEYRLSAK